MVFVLISGTAWSSPATVQAADTSGARADSDIRAPNTITYTLFLPTIGMYPTCQRIPSETYDTVAVISNPTNSPAEIHPDLNLAMRGYVSTTVSLGFVDLIGPPSDLDAPQLAGLFADNRAPIFNAAYRVNNWDWDCNCRGEPISDYEVTLAGLATTPGEIVQVPASGYDIGHVPPDFEAMVLYASPTRLTLKYTREDNVVLGYTIHLENICVEPSLLNLYDQMNRAGRSRLPALYVGQGVGRAITNEIDVAIRDTGAFLDPRSRLDWWQEQ